MSKLVLLSRFFLPMILLLMGCRKKIDHNSPLEQTNYFVEGMEVDSFPDWELLDHYSVFYSAYSLEIFNEELYIGTNDGLYRMVDFGQFYSGVINQLSFDNIYAMDVFNGELILGGEFNNAKPKRVNTWGGIVDINFANSDYVAPTYGVDSIGPNKLVFRGPDQSSSPPFRRTIEMVDDMYQPMEIPDLNTNLNVSGQSSVYCILSSPSLAGDLWAYSTQDGLVSWDGIGSNWLPITEPEMNGAIYSMIDFNGEIFVLGKVGSEYYLKKRDFSGVWSTFSDFSISSSSGAGKFKIADNELYIVGSELMVNGIESSILKLEGGITWKRIGKTTISAFDICKYKGRMYLGTSKGLHVLKE